MLYEKNKSEKLSPELFADPTAEYRAAPFWAWNCELDPKLLADEIESMKQMGFGGFHMHPRVGMSTPYLTDEFMKLIRGCVEKARGEDMLAWLYDEDKWPSGFAGGYVTKDEENREKYLLFTKTPYDDANISLPEDKLRATRELPKAKYTPVAAFDVTLDENLCLADYRRIGFDEPAINDKWFVYLQYDAPSSWFNNQAYCDTLRRDVIEKFVSVTHEQYKKYVGDEFGKLIPAIFTDEPQFARKRTLALPTDGSGPILPYTTDFRQSFEKANDFDIEDCLPELIWELPDGKVSRARYLYHDHVAERFASAFADTIGKWCRDNGILMTGHMMEEPTLRSQTAALGDAMRSYRSFGLPGIDMLADNRELTTAKQAQSATHQYGYPGVLSELYGVTNWTFDFRGHKLQGDWQAALGVTVRVPHLFWVSMRGEAKRDYPAAIGYQSPWYREYKNIEDHFARVNTVMTRGKPDVRIGVIHPVESYWLHWGPSLQTSLQREDMERRFTEITEWLLYGMLDFDFICESLLPQQFKGADGKCFNVGEMKYGAVVVPYCQTIRRTTLDALRTFRSKGGTVIFMGPAPTCVDAVETDEAEKFAVECVNLSWSRGALYSALEDERFVDIPTTSFIR